MKPKPKNKKKLKKKKNMLNADLHFSAIIYVCMRENLFS